MTRMGKGFRPLALTLAGAVAATAVPVGAVNASLVGTDRVIADRYVVEDEARAEVLDYLAREDVRQELAAQGVDPDEAALRVAALSDVEIAQIRDRIAHAPAGEGIGVVVGAILIVFIILLITDIAGFTSVFGFTR
jgi:hypothetical protein